MQELADLSQTNWRTRIEELFRLCEGREGTTHPEFYTPASSAALAALEQSLSVPLPRSLKSLLQQTDGICERLDVGGDFVTISWIVFCIEEIASTNTSHRRELASSFPQMRFQELLFFSSPGADGLLYAFTVRKDEVQEKEIVIWYPYENRLKVVAHSFEEFLCRRIRYDAF